MAKPKRNNGPITVKEIEAAQWRIVVREIERKRDEDYDRAMAEYEHLRSNR